MSKFYNCTPGNKTKFPYKHLHALPDPILLIYLTSISVLSISYKHNARADNPDEDEANPLPVGKELLDSTLIPYLSMSGISYPNSLSEGEFLYLLDENYFDYCIYSLNILNSLSILLLIGKFLPFISNSFVFDSGFIVKVVVVEMSFGFNVTPMLVFKGLISVSFHFPQYFISPIFGAVLKEDVRVNFLFNCVNMIFNN